MLRRLPVILLLATTSCVVADAGVRAVPTVPVAQPDTTSTSLAPTTTSEPPITTTTTTRPTTTTTALTTASLQPHESLALRSDHELHVYAVPIELQPEHTLEATTILGTPLVLRVLEGPIDGWARVSLPVRPNGSDGWVRTDGLTLFKVDRSVEVDLSDRRLVVSDGEGVLLETAVAVGSTTSPTPVGSFFVTDSVITGNDDGPWGPWAFGLSARSDVITEFNGGDGIIGIHGTNRPSSIGSAASLGCVRVPNEVAVELGELLSAGIPVEIRP